MLSHLCTPITLFAVSVVVTLAPRLHGQSRDTREGSVANHRMPAEFEPQSAIILGGDVAMPGVADVLCNVVRKIDGRVPVRVVAENRKIAHSVAATFKMQGIDARAATIVQIPHNSVWVRDFGPIFVDRSVAQAVSGMHHQPAALVVHIACR